MKAAVIFDLDGTLIDSAPDIHAATNFILAEEGLPSLGFDLVKSFVGHGLPHLVMRVLDHLGQPSDGALQAEFVRRFEARYETAHGLTQVYPGVVRALEMLQDAGHPMAICTNKPVAPARTVLDHLGLARFFPVVIGGDSLPLRKPDPAPLHAASAALGAQEVIFVGDSEVDAETARRAGVPFALFTEGYRKSPVADLPHDFAFGHHEDLPGFVFGKAG